MRRTRWAATMIWIAMTVGCGGTEEPVPGEEAWSDPGKADLAAVRNMTKRADGKFDVVCMDGTKEVRTLAEVLAGNVCTAASPQQPAGPKWYDRLITASAGGQSSIEATGHRTHYSRKWYLCGLPWDSDPSCCSTAKTIIYDAFSTLHLWLRRTSSGGLEGSVSLDQNYPLFSPVPVREETGQLTMTVRLQSGSSEAKTNVSIRPSPDGHIWVNANGVWGKSKACPRTESSLSAGFTIP